ncbi:hypothetical protein, partial [Enterobacter asburiae]
IRTGGTSTTRASVGIHQLRVRCGLVAATPPPPPPTGTNPLKNSTPIPANKTQAKKTTATTPKKKKKQGVAPNL